MMISSEQVTAAAISGQRQKTASGNSDSVREQISRVGGSAELKTQYSSAVGGILNS
jgi:hypothetical protein